VCPPVHFVFVPSTIFVHNIVDIIKRRHVSLYLFSSSFLGGVCLEQHYIDFVYEVCIRHIF